MPEHRPWRHLVASLCVIVVTLVTAGCGEPENVYVADKADRTFLRIPASWTKLDTDVIDFAFSPVKDKDSYEWVQYRQRLWSVAYDADPWPSSFHMTAGDANQYPVVYAAVLHLDSEHQKRVSFDSMRDFFVPVTAGLRDAVAQKGTILTDFELISDNVLTPAEGIRGIRTVFNYRLDGGIVTTFDQTVYVNNDSSIEYVLLFRCSFSGYAHFLPQIQAIAESFTIRSSP